MNCENGDKTLKGILEGGAVGENIFKTHKRPKKPGVSSTNADNNEVLIYLEKPLIEHPIFRHLLNVIIVI